MGIEGIPDDVVGLILRKITTGPSYGLRGWKRKLSILGVCRLWRAIAQQQVLGDLYVERYESKLRTNIGLTGWNGRRLTLMIENGTSNVETAIVSVLAVLELHAKVVGQATALRVEFSGHCSRPVVQRGSRRTGALNTVVGMIALGRQLAKLVPRVSDFRFSLGKADQGATLFGHVVAQAYNTQLVRLDTNTALCLPEPGFGGKYLALRTNVVGIRPQNHRQAAIDPRMVECLHLANIDYRFDWRVFLGSDDQVVEFGQLHILVLEMGAAPVRAPSNTLPGYLTDIEIHMPKLQSVHTEVTPLACLLLWTAQMPQMLEGMWMDCTDGTEIALHRVDVQRYRQALHRYAMRRMGASIGGIEFANDVLGNTDRLSVHCSAVVRAPMGDDSVARIRWTHLDSLDVRSRITWMALKELVARAPFLADLRAHCVVDVPPSVATDAEWHVMQGTRIRRAWIRTQELSQALI
ncbi:hypothetical protein EV175_000282 [Coemansia sp. RSA 1933]|nr:hypothetical protein EV175_000282 [Coemansia sp. RSA 1933]